MADTSTCRFCGGVSKYDGDGWLLLFADDDTPPDVEAHLCDHCYELLRRFLLSGLHNVPRDLES